MIDRVWCNNSTVSSNQITRSSLPIMSAAQGGESCGSGLGSDKPKIIDKKTKRHLSPKEERILLASMKELIANGWKSDNGFRGGYLSKLEKLMRKELPNTDLKGIPNLHSKLQAWKRNYNSLTTMLSRSGIRFKDHMIDCTDDQWEEIVKVDSNAKAMRRCSWAMFDDWKEIFGKDRATGDNAEDVLDIVNDLLAQDNTTNEEMERDYHVSLDGLEETSAWEQSVCGSENGVGKNGVCGGEIGEAFTKGKGRKRKAADGNESIIAFLHEISKNTNAHMENMVSRIGYEYDLDEAKKEAYKLLENIPELSIDDKFYVCDTFAEKPEKLIVFKGLPDTARPHYLQRLLKLKKC